MRKLRFERPDVADHRPDAAGHGRVADHRGAARRRCRDPADRGQRPRHPSRTRCTRSGSAATTTWPSRSGCRSSWPASRPRPPGRHRAGGRPRERIEVPGLVIDPDLHRRLLDGQDAELTRTEFRLLSVLASERGRVMTRDQLQQRVWGVPYRPRDRSVDVCVRKLREKLDQRSRSTLHPHALRRRLSLRCGAARGSRSASQARARRAPACRPASASPVLAVEEVKAVAGHGQADGVACTECCAR